MDKDIKAKWMAALRSDSYRQGCQVLRRGNTFCCLGVLCDLHTPDGWDAPEDDCRRGQPVIPRLAYGIASTRR